MSFDFSNRKTIIAYLCVILAVCFSAAAFFAAAAAQRSGRYWSVFSKEKVVVADTGFTMIDITGVTFGKETKIGEKEETVSTSIGIGLAPSVSSYTSDELRLYGMLSQGDGTLSPQHKEELTEATPFQEIVLEEGDTIESIAEQFGVSAEDIRKANDLKPAEQKAKDEVLFIPDSHEYVEKVREWVVHLNEGEKDLEKGGKTFSVTAYVVKEGDSMWAIANRFNIGLDTIAGSNSVKNIEKLKPGVVLRIPNQDGVFVTVKKGDTLEGLAKKYNSYVNAIMKANGLKNDTDLKENSEVFLPGGNLLAVAESRGKRGSMVVRVDPSRIINNRNKKSSSIMTNRKNSGRMGQMLEKQKAGQQGSVIRMSWPCAGSISSPFGIRKSPFGKRSVFHAGIDIRAPRGTPIHAAGPGTVIYSGWMSGYGRTIVIQHQGGFTSLYGHCSRLTARVGRQVSTGDVIALVGSTGRSTGNHCHFEVRRGGRTPINPMRCLR